ncbi:uncharacterized protein BT62DRAFT_959370 [Guyanagaster necrorhizus]|uniref:C3H1-type domain-containing protein n=1 Tax=Guyanagaster necrorhizus TaxID=856835 RepID=A0A9P8AZ24_9AGAR|nr:uncharacterized protein BT62DRAFT_959370 [Guyanagaster necrorhizus MCA 3950]KAG7453095.1 hypothetical protein BT62DRAFT_959370 [Guyanagaster necrorhizus MCA 3950]
MSGPTLSTENNASHRRRVLPADNPSIQALEARAKKRAEHSAQRREEAEIIKNQGNDFFKAQKYAEAAQKYCQALHIGGPKAVIMCNLAAAFLKLEFYDLAEEVANQALIRDPAMQKARYRRGMARTGLHRYRGALIDFETILRSDPDSEHILSEAQAARDACFEGLCSMSDDSCASSEYEAPSEDRVKDDSSTNSDSSDCHHIGNGIACRYYNHGGCRRGESCAFSHAPDEKSVRDNLGKNVCLYFLLGNCKFGDAKCIYSHTRLYLREDGFWNYEEATAVLRYIYEIKTEEERMERRLMRNPFRLVPRDVPYNTVPGGRASSRSVADKIRSRDFPTSAQASGSGSSQPRGKAKGKKKASSSSTSPSAPTPSSSKAPSDLKDPFVLILSLSHVEYYSNILSHLFSALKAKISTKQAFTASSALQLLSSSQLVGVLVTDAGIASRRHMNVLTKLVEWTQAGGYVVVGGMFSGNISGTDMGRFFGSSWGLPWRMGSYHRTTFARNEEHSTAKQNPSLPSSYSMKAVHLNGLDPSTALYKATTNSHIESLVFAATPIENLAEAPAAQTRVGNGYFGYLGDVNGEDLSTPVVLAMLGLLDQKHPAPLASTTGAPSRSAAARPSPSTKFILLLSLENKDHFDEIYADFLCALRSKARVERALTQSEALTFLASSDLGGVFVTGPSVTQQKHNSVLTKLIEYTKAGGLVVIGGLFSTSISSLEMDGFWLKWGQPWKMGSYHRETFFRNANNATVQVNPSLSKHYSMKAVYLKNVNSSAAMYKDSDQSGDIESPAIHTKLGSGYLGYLGDVNAEKSSTNVLLSMLGLLDFRYDAPPTSSASSSPATGSGRSQSVVRRPNQSTNSFILLISLENEPFFEDIHKNLLTALRSKRRVVQALSADEAIQSLASPDLTGVFVTDPGIIRKKHNRVLTKLVNYTKDGGLVVFGGLFSSVIRPPEMDKFWSTAWGISWRMGSYRREMFYRQGNDTLKSSKCLPASYSMKAVHLKGINSAAAVYKNRDQHGELQAPVVRMKFGMGYLGYLGDVNAEDESTKVVLAMLGLLDNNN